MNAFLKSGYGYSAVIVLSMVFCATVADPRGATSTSGGPPVQTVAIPKPQGPCASCRTQSRTPLRLTPFWARMGVHLAYTMSPVPVHW